MLNIWFVLTQLSSLCYVIFNLIEQDMLLSVQNLHMKYIQSKKFKNCLIFPLTIKGSHMTSFKYNRSLNPLLPVVQMKKIVGFILYKFVVFCAMHPPLKKVGV